MGCVLVRGVGGEEAVELCIGEGRADFAADRGVQKGRFVHCKHVRGLSHRVELFSGANQSVTASAAM
jgi:hypothetical protein